MQLKVSIIYHLAVKAFFPRVDFQLVKVHKIYEEQENILNFIFTIEFSKLSKTLSSLDIT